MTINQSRHYTTEFKAQILAMIKTGKLVNGFAKDFGITTSMIYPWMIYPWKQSSQRSQLGNKGRRAVGELLMDSGAVRWGGVGVVEGERQ